MPLKGADYLHRPRRCRKHNTGSLTRRLLQRPAFLLGFLFLLSDVLPYRFLVQIADYRYVVPSRPEVPLKFVPQFRVSVVDHQRWLSLQVPYKLAYHYLRGYAQAQVHMISAYRSLDNLHLLVSAQCSQYLAYICLYLPIQHFPTIFRNKHNMVLAFPFRM